ncbi:unnamed protein product [Heterobilharzia americana]|nr:unnamed protein product [Heterobilharzia americana]
MVQSIAQKCILNQNTAQKFRRMQIIRPVLGVTIIVTAVCGGIENQLQVEEEEIPPVFLNMLRNNCLNKMVLSTNKYGTQCS